MGVIFNDQISNFFFSKNNNIRTQKSKLKSISHIYYFVVNDEGKRKPTKTTVKISMECKIKNGK